MFFLNIVVFIYVCQFFCALHISTEFNIKRKLYCYLWCKVKNNNFKGIVLRKLSRGINSIKLYIFSKINRLLEFEDVKRIIETLSLFSHSDSSFPFYFKKNVQSFSNDTYLEWKEANGDQELKISLTVIYLNKIKYYYSL